MQFKKLFESNISALTINTTATTAESLHHTWILLHIAFRVPRPPLQPKHDKSFRKHAIYTLSFSTDLGSFLV